MINTVDRIRSILVEVSSKSRLIIGMMLLMKGFTVYNHFNDRLPHSRERRAREGIDAENIVFTRR